MTRPCFRAARYLITGATLLLPACWSRFDRTESDPDGGTPASTSAAWPDPERAGSGGVDTGGTAGGANRDDKARAETMADDTRPKKPETTGPETTEIATFGAGCFWCVEAVLEQLDGVVDVSSGYMGGRTPHPTYEQVCGGATGHAEVVQVTFDPARISYEKLLEKFWKLHDPTTLNRQGNDVGTQYRSAIFYHSEAQREAAEKSKKEAAELFSDPIVTEITKASEYYVAENYHQDYYRLNRRQPYCRYVIAPKLDKLGLEK